MRAFRHLSIKWKLTLIIMITSAAALLLSCAAFVGYEVITFRRGMVRELSTQAEIIGSNNAGNLRFYALGIDTKDDAEQILNTLQVNQHIVSACIYSQEGKIFAKYLRGDRVDDFPAEPLENKHRFEDNHLVLFKPIIQDNDRVGTVYIKSDLEEMYARLKQYAGIVAMFMLGAFVIAFVLSSILQRIISKPILQLAQTTRIVSDNKDYSVRAVKHSQDEVGMLIDGFNEMLTQIQERDVELMTATENLEVSKGKLEDYSRTLAEKVDARTRELKDKNVELEETLQQLKEMQHQIIMQQKLASLGALTAGIAHEIKNPLNFVTNFAELSTDLTQELREDIEKQKGILEPQAFEDIEDILDDLRKNAEKINEHGKRADSIVRNMLLHSRGRPGERQKTDINALMAEYVNLAYHGMRAKESSFNIKIETDYDNSIGLVEVVPQDLSRVFLNILNNACDAAYKKKKEMRDEFSPTLSVVTKNLDDLIEIRIHDNGKGIPRENLDKIFNPFFTTKPTGEGTGLGLSISYDIIVEEHKGEIKVETEEGSYTEFIISLPKNANQK